MGQNQEANGLHDLVAKVTQRMQEQEQRFD
jgi:hypothetical protein